MMPSETAPVTGSTTREARRLYATVLAVATGVIITLVAWKYAADQYEDRLVRQFAEAVDRQEDVIAQRLVGVTATLRSLRGLLLASSNVSGWEWYTFLSAIHSPDQSDVLRGLAVVTMSDDGDRARVRYRDVDLMGIGFHSVPLEEVPAWKRALAESRETGEPVVIVDDAHLQPEASTRRGTVLITAHNSWRGDYRWIAADIDLEAVIALFHEGVRDGLVIELAEAAGPNERRRIETVGEESSAVAGFHAVRALEIGTGRWDLTVRATPAFIGARSEVAPRLILWFGLSGSLLFGAFVYAVLKRQTAAVALAARMSESLHETEAEAEKLALVASRTDNAVMILDTELAVEWANEAFLRLSKLPLEEVIGRRVCDMVEIDPEHASVAKDLQSDIVHGRGHSVELRLRLNDGGWRWVSADVQPTLNADEDVSNIIIVARDITARRESEAVLLHRSTHDDLTGLLNRVYLMERLHDRLRIVQRNPGHRFAVIFMDLDRFKVINDSLGHAMGDRFLVAVADRLRQAVSDLRERIRMEGTTIARLGGDEFTVVVEGIADDRVPTMVARALQQALSLPFDLDGQVVVTSASMGIALSDSRYRFAEELLRDADIAMYRAKAEGRSRFEVFDQAMHEDIRARLELENDLRLAVERDEFELHYQPLVNLVTGELHGFEALMRWRHPERGLVSPTLFIPVAEETGLIVQLGRKALAGACIQLREWQRQFPQIEGLSVSVNLSVKQLADPALVQKIETIVASTHIRPGTLKLEITESAIMDDLDTMRRLLGQLKTLNVQLWMDDFGTGYSSLSCLHQFPLDGIKIDKSFIQSMKERQDLTAVVMAIVALSHHLNMPIVAEGIETEDQLVQLQALECDIGQGYYFARPLPVDEAGQFIADFIARDGRWRVNLDQSGPIPLHNAQDAAA